MISVRCPICGRVLEEPGPYAPFCSDRCRLIDLGRWLGESYRIASENTGEDPEADCGNDGLP